jgi:hypothetical protein
MTVDELRREALSLDLATRPSLSRDLLNSLDDLSEREVEQLWVEEAARRHDEIVSGAAHTIPADDAIAKARSSRG